MSSLKRLPEAEFEVMKTVWDNPSGITAGQAAALLLDSRGWTPQTLLTMLNRLEGKGFLASEKQGKERIFTPVVAREAYLSVETDNFLKAFHRNSVTGLLSALYVDRKIQKEELDELERWLQERK